MNEHDHIPPKKHFAVQQIGPRTVHFCVNGRALFISPDEVRKLIAEFEDALAGPGPQIVREVVERRRI